MSGERAEPAIVYVGEIVDAQVVWSRLRGHGIDAHLLDQHVTTLAPWLLGTAQVKVAVPADEIEDALAILRSDEEVDA